MANLRKIKDDANTAAISLLRHLLNQDQVEDSATNFTEEERKELAKKGLALPDGSFPIRNKEDLKDAIRAIGLGRDYDKTKAWIIKRAKALNAVDVLPEKWKVKGSKVKDDVDTERVISTVESNFPEWEKEEDNGYFDIADVGEGIVFAEHNVSDCKAAKVDEIMTKFGYNGVDHWKDGDSYYFYYIKEQ